MKKMMCLALTVVMLACCLLTGCAKKEESKDRLEEIKERGKIIVAMEGTWAPWTYHDENDQLVGFDTEVAAAIARELGVEVEYVEGEFDGLLAGVDSGRYDMVVNGVDVTEERQLKYNFTDPYAYDHTLLIVRADNEEITCFEDLDGKQTANTLTSSYAALSESYGAKTTGVDTLEETMNLVLAGRVDATLNAEMSYNDYLLAHPDVELKVVDKTEEATHLAIPLKKGAETDSLRAAINDAIAKLHESGELAQISEKYFGSDITNN